jgi:putative heme-binding domain-containing protein
MIRPGFLTRIAWALLGMLPATFAANLLDEDYNQWKAALGTNTATPAERITGLPGFQIQLIHSATRSEGSWVAMAFDSKGRVVLAREDRGLLRLSLANQPSARPRMEVINTNLLECRGLLFAHGSLYANANNAKALVRLRDTDGDDQFDEVKALRNTPGGVGHGRNQLALGPDGMIYSIHGDDVGLPSSGASPNSPLKHYAEDRLLPCEWDRHLFNADAQMPFGHLIRTDPNGEQWELVAGGLRNPFGVDFNQAGDLFTFDADMEWDVGLSWYHPTRVLHLVPGGDYGWRRGTGVLPVWSPDTLPSAADIGVSSPTAIKFGTRSNWPEPWKSALFIQDWSYGKIIAVHLQKHGGSYTGRTEIFLKGKPLNVTGLDFGPDGSLYFITGGRRTQSGLYRVSFTNMPTGVLVRELHAKTAPAAPPKAPLWSRLGDNDHWIRYGARVELEAQPIAQWSERALTESNPSAALTALLALSRAGDAAHRPRILQRWTELTTPSLLPEQQLLAIRAVSVCFLRMGKPSPEEARKVQRILDPLYPSTDTRVNQSLCELLVYVGATNVVSKTIPLLTAAATQEEKFHYLFTLRTVANGWSPGDRDTYFSWLARARREFNGANMLPTALNYIRADAESTLTAEERTRLAPALALLEKPATADLPPPVARAFVRDWSMQDLLPDLSRAGQTRNTARGKRLFAETGCLQCHRLGNEGGFIGPDLTSVSSRFDRRALLESIVEPSRVISETYRSVTITLKSGAIHDGRIVSEDPASLVLAINPVDPDQRRRMAKSDIATKRVSDISPMPAGLVNTLDRDEILDLLAWMESGGTAIQTPPAGRARE